MIYGHQDVVNMPLLNLSLPYISLSVPPKALCQPLGSPNETLSLAIVEATGEDEASCDLKTSINLWGALLAPSSIATVRNSVA